MLKTILLPVLLITTHYVDTVTPTPSPTITHYDTITPTIPEVPQLIGYEIGTQTGREDEVFKFDVPVNDIFYNSDELTYSASEAEEENLPAWFAFNTKYSNFFGLPSAKDIGTYNISLTATNQAGGEASTYFLVDIVEKKAEEDTMLIKGIIFLCFSVISIFPACGCMIFFLRKILCERIIEDESGNTTYKKYCHGNYDYLCCYFNNGSDRNQDSGTSDLSSNGQNTSLRVA